MHKRPVSITIISWIFIAAGVVGLAYHSTHPSENNILWILFVRFLAIVCGVGMLFRQGWARWLTTAWLAYHVYLSVHHKTSELIIHGLLLAVMVFFLFRAPATAYFHGKDAPPASPAPDSAGHKPG